MRYVRKIRGLWLDELGKYCVLLRSYNVIELLEDLSNLVDKYIFFVLFKYNFYFI